MAIPELVTYAYGAWHGLRKKPLNSVAPPCLPPLPLLTPDTALGGSGRWGMEGDTSKAPRNVFYVMALRFENTAMSPSILPANRRLVFWLFQSIQNGVPH